MTYSPPPQAFVRPRQTIQAAEVFHDHARSIGAACAEAAPAEVVVAAVGPDFGFAGVWVFPLREVRRRVPEVEPKDGWSMTFAAGATVRDIEEQTLRLARASFRRWEALRYWSSRHRGDDEGE